ncbi:hypothetical protein [Brachybacterium fresconis]|uniref:Uncharacterized protein n=1 Tax=Brachybacterium fresconis TaxID=173363 RepID=A0ABS4YHN4_9MICO|nr:hypothetical protein [Brachybacterium fresconis]MBP2408269.1 hypothetical protein [Brachybacterium fresconis]
MTPGPRTVAVRPWRWHYDETGTVELCMTLSDRRSQIIIPAWQLRDIADALHDRADEQEQTS